MTIHVRESEYQTIYVIQHPDMANQSGLFESVDDLHSALDHLIADGRMDHHFSFEFRDNGCLFGEDVPRDLHAYHEPDHASVLEFTVAAYKYPELRHRMMAWLVRVEGILRDAGPHPSIWQDDENQLGEPIATMLAMLDRKFIRNYARLLALWDMDHEVFQNNYIGQIIQRHGFCPEVEEVLFCRAAVNIGQHGDSLIDELFPQLEAHYGDFTATPLFDKIVTYLHTKHASRRAEVLVKNPNTIVERSIFRYTRHTKLKRAAEALLVKLDAILESDC